MCKKIWIFVILLLVLGGIAYCVYNNQIKVRNVCGGGIIIKQNVTGERILYDFTK